MKTFKEFLNEGVEWAINHKDGFIETRATINGIMVEFGIYGISTNEHNWRAYISSYSQKISELQDNIFSAYNDYLITDKSINKPIDIIRAVKKKFDIDIPYTEYKKIQNLYNETMRRDNENI